MNDDANDNGASDGVETAPTLDDAISEKVSEFPKPRKPGTFDSSRAKDARARVGAAAAKAKRMSKRERLAWKVIDRALENPDTPEYVARQYAELALKYERGAPVSMRELGNVDGVAAPVRPGSSGLLETLQRMAERKTALVDAPALTPSSPATPSAPAPMSEPTPVENARPTQRQAPSTPRGLHLVPPPPAVPVKSLGDLDWRPAPGGAPGAGGGSGGGRCA